MAVGTTFEERSCLNKKRYDHDPQKPGPRPKYLSYDCQLCGGWHLTTNREWDGGDVRYTDEGWPIVPRQK